MDEYFVEEKTTVDRVLDFLVFVAVFIVTIFLVLEILAQSGNVQSLDIVEINDIYAKINLFIFIIFFADLIRLRKESVGWSEFFRNNWLDVLATIPFGLIANAGVTSNVLKLGKLGRIAKLQKASRISKIGKEFKAAAHLKKESNDYQQKHRL